MAVDSCKASLALTDCSTQFVFVSHFSYQLSPGALAGSCNPATWRQVLLDGLKVGALVTVGSCRSGVRTKVCINMALLGEPRRIRLTKTGRTGSGGKLSSQESLCGSVVG